MDRIGADFDRTLGQVRDRLKGNPVVLTIPIGAGHDFKGIIDLLQMKALYFDRETMGREIEVTDIPEDMQDTAATWRSRLLDAVSMLDDDIMTAYLEGEEISADEINRVLRAGTLARELQPTYCGSSLDYCGVQPVLDGVNNYLPSPLDIPPVEGINPKPKKGEDEHAIRKVDVDEPFAGLIFKIAADKHADMCFVRVYSGVLKSGSRALNPRTGRKELISQLWHIQAGHREKIETDAVEAGGIVGVIGPKDVVTGDTLCDQKHPIILESISFPETVISMAVEPDSSADRKKLEDALLQLAKQDPTFKAKVSDETGQTIISGMGELHLEVLRERLQRDFNLNVKVHKPRVSYRETVQKPVEAEGEFSRTTAGETQFARVRIRVEPFETERGVEVDSELTPGELPKEQIRIVLETIQEAAQSGGVVGYPLMKVRFHPRLN